MSHCVDIAAWRRPSREELLAVYENIKKKPKSSKGSLLVIRKHLRPSDVYAYLRARFGQPNGIQNFLRNDDSDNLVHWDFNLKSHNEDVYLSGTSREIHLMTSEKLSDEQWFELIDGFKREFARMGREKSAMMKSFEKYIVFQNKYIVLSGLCAEMHETISDAPPANIKFPDFKTDDDIEKIKQAAHELSERATNLYGDCLKLRLLTPIMAEAFINMLILIFCKDSIRNDPKLYENFIRSKIPERLDLLSQHCDGFTRPIDRRSTSYRDFMRIMNARNFNIHGNVDPNRDPVEIVYFEGKRPLFSDNGDHTLKLFEHLEFLNNPAEVLQDYISVHGFLHELTTLLSPQHSAFFEAIINDPYPGYEVHKKRVNRILPNHNAAMLLPGLKYDDELAL